MKPIIYISLILIVTLILIEIIELKANNSSATKLKDIYTNIYIGIIFIVMGLLFRGLLIASLSFLHEFSFFKISPTWYHWIFLFLILDFVHYCVHYMEHRIRIFWAIHSVHHSSEHFNYSTAIRGPLGTSVYILLYSAPLCVIGFEPLNVIIIDHIILLYAFILHTERVKKLGVIEYFMSTPSHHRVHHGSNDEYLDKNYGACLIIWDRLFGTFKSEDVKQVYGIRSTVNNSNPILIITHEWSRLISDLRSTNDFRDWFNYIFNKPNWSPSSIGMQRKYFSPSVRLRNPEETLVTLSLLKIKILHWFQIITVKFQMQVIRSSSFLAAKDHASTRPQAFVKIE